MANYSIKSIDQCKYGEYQNFGWVRSKREFGAEEKKKHSKEPQMFVKRRNGFSYNPRLLELESRYEKLSKKKFHKGAAVIVGIIFFILMIAFLAVAGVELYYGISKGVEISKFPGTYYFYGTVDKKTDSVYFTLDKANTWDYSKQTTGNLEIKNGTISFYTVDKDNNKTLVYTGTVKDGVLTVTTNTKTPKTTKYFTDTCKEEKKLSPVATPANASQTDTTTTDTATTENKGILDTIKGVLDNVHDNYLSKVTGIFDGKTDDAGVYTDGIADKVGAILPSPVNLFISADTLVGLIAFILFIVCLIIFCECSAKQKKKYLKRQGQIASILAEAKSTVQRMKENDMSLMNKGERKMYMWETVISNGIRKANGGDDEDDD